MRDVVIRGARVVGGDAATIGELVVRDGRVAPAGAPPAPGSDVVDADGLLAAPGLVDLQVNGVAGPGGSWDLAARPEDVGAVAEVLVHQGVTAFLPTLVSSSAGARAAARRALAAAQAGAPAAQALGWHLEGPLVAAARAGAHDAAALVARPPADVDSWTADWVRLVTLAPELDGAAELVSTLVARGVTVALGHTSATTACVEDAVARGARVVTHLFDAMVPMHHREPGPVGVALTDERVVATLIADGEHVHPRVVDLAWRALGPRRLALVSDAVGDTVGGRRPPPGALAGGRVPLLRMVRNLVRFAGASVDDALGCATRVPAAVVGATGRGHLRGGAVGDVVLLTPQLELAGVVRGGVVVRRP